MSAEELTEWKKKKHQWVTNIFYDGEPLVFVLDEGCLNPLKRGGTLIVEGIPGEDLMGMLEPGVYMDCDFAIAVHFILDETEIPDWDKSPDMWDYGKTYTLGLRPGSLKCRDIDPDKKYMILIEGAKVFIYNEGRF